MFTPEIDKFTEIVDITLYKYNSIDLKIWGLIKRNNGHKKLSGDSILVKSDVLKSIVNQYFRNELNRIDALSDTIMHKEATSVYFLDLAFKSMHKLSWVKITLNKNSNYHRVVEVDDIKTIKYSIKTIRGTLRLFDIYNTYELGAVNKLLYRSGLLEDGAHFKVFRVRDLLQSIDLYMSEHNTTEILNLLGPIITYLENYETDNPEVLLITDIDSDI